MGEMSIFRVDTPPPGTRERFEEDGFVAFAGVLTDECREGLLQEMLGCRPLARGLESETGERPTRFILKPWNDKGPWAEGLFDAPLVQAVLRMALGDEYHFCHSSLHFTERGYPGLRFHHDNPEDPTGVRKANVQMLYYPNGFTRGDAGLRVIPGSHEVVHRDEPGSAPVLNEWRAAALDRPLREQDLELPPGSLVALDARTYHAVTPKPVDSPQGVRLFSNYIFKPPGPPSPLTQEIPPDWLTRAGSERRRLFDRPAYDRS
jgi:hypothetical protein